MPAIRRPDGVLALGGVALADVARDAAIGTPAYVYDLDAIASEARDLVASFDGAPHMVAYAVKANAAGPILRRLFAEGCGADVVSGAELTLALRAGLAPDRVVFNGVAKTDDEIDLAIGAGESGIGALQAESAEEVARIGARARARARVCRVSLRINPGLDAETVDTHRHITTGHDDAKFGIPLACVAGVLATISASPELRLVGLTSHIGSQLTSVDGYLASARVLFTLAREVRSRFALSYLDTGGGFGIDYGEGCPVRPSDFIRATRRLQAELGLADLALYCEPGRALVAAHGVLLARVIQRKVAGPRRWTMIDAGMNDLMRPALYQAFHRIVPLVASAGATAGRYRVVGPVCESSDDFGVHELPDDTAEAVLREVAILDAGAYGYAMASQYNGRPLPSEVFVAGGCVVGATSRRSTDEWVAARLAAGTP